MAPQRAEPHLEDPYETPAGLPGIFARMFPSLSFYSRAGRIVWRSSRLANKNAYGYKEWTQASYDILRALETAGVRIEIENVSVFKRLESPCVIVGNHMSTMETFLLPCLVCPHQLVTFVVKESLVRYPVFGSVMRSRDPVVVGRENAREDLKAVLEGGAERLANGISIIVFPQTTRTPAFHPKDFNSIGIKLAKRAKVPVVPLALKTDAWGNGWPLKDVGWVRPGRRAHFRFGEPMTVTGNGSAQHEAATDFIRENLTAWGGTVVEE